VPFALDLADCRVLYLLNRFAFGKARREIQKCTRRAISMQFRN
jgi:hypothetical protein